MYISAVPTPVARQSKPSDPTHGHTISGCMCSPTSRPAFAKYCFVALIPEGNISLEMLSSCPVECQLPQISKQSAIFKHKIIILQGRFSNISAFPTENSKPSWNLCCKSRTRVDENIEAHLFGTGGVARPIFLGPSRPPPGLMTGSPIHHLQTFSLTDGSPRLSDMKSWAEGECQPLTRCCVENVAEVP